MTKIFPTGGFKWFDHTKFNLDKNYDGTLRGYVIEIELEYYQELHELHNNYPLAPDELDIKKEILAGYQLKIVDDYDISIVNVKQNYFLTPSTKRSRSFITKK